MKQLDESKVVIIGLGLMGGSIAGALRGKCRRVRGVARRDETVEQAIAHGLIDEGTTDVKKAVQDADIAIIATPVRTIIDLVHEIGNHLPPGAILLDLGSTKEEILRSMEGLPAHVQPLGAHPMCGKELSGIGSADPGLYWGKTFILIPLSRTSPQTVDTGRDLARAVGAIPLVITDARRHDFLVGTLSHIPYLLACALVRTADATTSEDPVAWEIVASGFRDTSRVAASDVEMMTDIVLTNRREILNALQEYTAQLHELERLIDDKDEQGLRRALSYAREKRMEMFP